MTHIEFRRAVKRLALELFRREYQRTVKRGEKQIRQIRRTLMMKSTGWLIPMLMLASGACASTDPIPPVRGPAVEVSLPTVFVQGEQGHGTAYDICSVLPEEGPCSLVCDPERFAEEYGIPGACAVYLCETTEGDRFRAHVCTPEGP